jgi:flavodoxin
MVHAPSTKEDPDMKRALVVYWSKTGNTEKVASAIREGLETGGVQAAMLRPEQASDVDFFTYDLVCVGCPSYQWHPPKPIDDFMKMKMAEYRTEGRIQLGAPKLPGRNALVFCTYSGPHTGINEAIPVVKYLGQFFEHLGFDVLGEWYVLGEFHGSETASTGGRMGDIRGRPNEDDVAQVRADASQLAAGLGHQRGPRDR